MVDFVWVMLVISFYIMGFAVGYYVGAKRTANRIESELQRLITEALAATLIPKDTYEDK